MDKELNIVSFSGGKDSTAMLLRMIEENYKIDEIIFCDTGVEFPQIYKHIEQVSKYINKKITIIRSEKSFEYYMCEHIKTKGKNKGKKGYGWMDFRNRWCTTLLKIYPYKQYLKKYINNGYKIIEYHGIAFDESVRANKNLEDRNIIYPLIDWKMTEKDCLNYCYEKGFDWDGLYNKFDRLSCYLCGLSTLKELKVLYNDFPELWSKMVELDKKSFRKFRKDYTLKELEEKFKN